MTLSTARVLVVGVGGLGCPAAIALARGGVGTLGLVDGDAVDATNLHRQILFSDNDVGALKVTAGASALAKLAPSVRIETFPVRLSAQNAVDIVQRFDLVVEGTDDFATKFLAADVARIADKPIVHAAAIQWHGTVLATTASGRPCYRCLFEDVPRGRVPNCSEAGVIGPVVGILAAAQADLALRMLSGEDVGGSFLAFDGRTLEVRRRSIPRRPDCPLCGDGRDIRDIQAERYSAAACTT